MYTAGVWRLVVSKASQNTLLHVLPADGRCDVSRPTDGCRLLPKPASLSHNVGRARALGVWREGVVFRWFAARVTCAGSRPVLAYLRQVRELEALHCRDPQVACIYFLIYF